MGEAQAQRAWFPGCLTLRYGCLLPFLLTGIVPAAVLIQAFNWESHKRQWYKDMVPKVADWAKQGFTAIWLPPPSDSVSPQVRGQQQNMGML
jgi:hypothetical protein